MTEEEERGISVDEMHAYLKDESRIRGSVLDHSKVEVEGDVIHYKLYGQDGSFIPMTCKNTYSNRCLVSWIQMHDRYT